MIGSLDRTLELAICAMVDAEASDAGLSVPHLLGEGDASAVCPRVIVRCESGQSDLFMEQADGIYGIFPVTVTMTCMAEARHADSATQMQAMTTAVDSVLIYNGDLTGQLTGGTLKVFGVVPGTVRQEMSGERLLRHREILIWARLETGSGLEFLTEDGQVIITEDGEVLITE
jgi:hypothetical protein